MAGIAGVLHNLTRTAALGTGSYGGYRAKHGLLHHSLLPCPVTGRAAFGMTTCLRACTMAGFTFIINCNGNFFFAAKNCLLKGQLDAYVYILPASGAVSFRSAAAKAAEAEHTAEDIAQIAHIKALTAIEAATAAHAALFKGRMTELVILRTLLAVTQNLIRFVDFLEFFFCIFIPGILVRMVFYCHLTVSLFQLRICGILLYAQYLIIISFICQLTHHLAGDLPLCYLNSKAGCPALSVGTLAFCLFLSIRFLSRHRLLHRSRRPVQLRPV